jgi:hypothetical protein
LQFNFYAIKLNSRLNLFNLFFIKIKTENYEK